MQKASAAGIKKGRVTALKLARGMNKQPEPTPNKT
jgi:hypothetical protein